jgi:hypothetical protein
MLSPSLLGESPSVPQNGYEFFTSGEADRGDMTPQILLDYRMAPDITEN